MQHPAFIIVGTPRSGTTLVQRVATDLAGVRVPPETHFFSDFVSETAPRCSMPLEGLPLRAVLRDFSDRPYLRDVPFDADAVLAALGGRCESWIDLYGAITRHLAGDAAVIGEKTPNHLLWWRPLTRSLPDLKLICVLRDPRAVVSSYLQVGWGRHPVATAHRWKDDVRRIRKAARDLGPRRCLVLRYEQVVADPSLSRASIASFLGVPDAETADVRSPDLFAPWEVWKGAALGPVDAARTDAWRRDLEPEIVAAVDAICRVEMDRLGYDGAPGLLSAVKTRLLLPSRVQFHRLRHIARRYRRQAEIVRISRHWPVVDEADGHPGRR